jgi:hypothetical protein
MAYTPLDMLKAKALAEGIKAMIGSAPTIEYVGDQYIEIVFTEAQRQQLIAYLDQRVGRAFSAEPQAAPTIQIAWGDVLIPWSIKYLAPAMVALFGLGFMTNAILFSKGR